MGGGQALPVRSAQRAGPAGAAHGAPRGLTAPSYPHPLRAQALFRKIAAALPGMDGGGGGGGRGEDMVSVQLAPATVQLSGPPKAAASSCAC